MAITRYSLDNPKGKMATLYIIGEFAKGRSLRSLQSELGISRPTLIRIKRDYIEMIEKFKQQGGESNE